MGNQQEGQWQRGREVGNECADNERRLEARRVRDVEQQWLCCAKKRAAPQEAMEVYEAEYRNQVSEVALRVAARESGVSQRELRSVVQRIVDVISSSLVVFAGPRAKEGILKKVFEHPICTSALPFGISSAE